MNRTITISLSHNPPISGYGGFDEWTITDLTPEQIDFLVKQLDRVIGWTCKRFNKQGGWTGVS